MELSSVEQMVERLGVSRDAVELCRESEVVDLHLDTFISVRMFGYDIRRRHGPGPLRGRLFGQLDLPRLLDGGLSAGMWSITTNPARGAAGRWRVFQENLTALCRLAHESDGQLAVARTMAEYEQARAAGAHAFLPAVQGGNCFDAAPEGVLSVPERLITRVTLVHLTNSAIGATSAPISRLRRARGLTPWGFRLVEQMNQARIFVDLAHIHPDSFWDVIDAHDRSQPLLSTHTGVCGVTPHWRNLDDRQIKAIAGTGGLVGIIFQSSFLGRKGGPKDGRMVIDHMEHVINVAGEDCVAIGTDFDGAILPPDDLRGGDTYPRLVQHMLDRGWSESRIRKILGGNFLRAFTDLRPG